MVAIVASSTEQYRDDAQVGPSLPWGLTKLKEINITTTYTGSWRITFVLNGAYDLGDFNESAYAYARIYKNGVAYGTQRSVFGNNPTKFSQEFTSINIAVNDKIQLYGYADASWFDSGDYTSYVRDFDILFDAITPTQTMIID